MKLTIKNLSKTYDGDVMAIRNLSLELSPGMFGLLGPNGAGKSSLMRTLATLQEPDQGQIQLGDWDLLRQPQAVRRVLGYLPQSFGVYPKVSAWELLNHYAILKGISNKKERRQIVDHLLHLTNLHQVRKKAVSSFSGGMARRWGIAQALLGDPKLIIVDEPTAGLDPEERARFHNLLGDISQNVIVLLSTHMVNDVAELCSRMAVMNQGQLLLTGNPLNLISGIEGCIWKKFIPKNERAAYRERYDLVSSGLVLGETMIRIYSKTPPGHGFQRCDTNLEDVYFSAIAGYLTEEVSQ